jgi:non-lysosomal glucosylceramidase
LGRTIIIRTRAGETRKAKLYTDPGGLVNRSIVVRALVVLVLIAAPLQIARAQDSSGAAIPKAAWRRPLGQALANPGVKRNATDIDDGYWQRTYRGDFARWHIKAGVHKYETVNANQFAMFQQVEGEPAGFAQVLMTDHPKDGALASWNWDYPAGAGEYAALYPKSWFDYKSDKFPAHVTL